MRLLKTLSPIFCFLLLTGCDFFDDRLIINNKSNSNIYAAFTNDTVLSLYSNRTFMIAGNHIEAHNKRNIIEPDSRKAWEVLANKSFNKELHIFILIEDTLKKYEPNEIIKLKKFEKRIDIGVKELEASNWEIIYEK